MSGLSRLIRFAIPPAGAAASAAAGAFLWPTRAATRADFGPPKAPGRESWVTSVGGARLRVVAYGPEDAPPIVFSHGWTCDAEVWLPQVHALAEQYRVVTYDQRGHGQSSIGDGVRIELLGDDLSAVLSASLRPGERAVVVGHSMGGITIMSWAQRHPQDVQEQANAVVLTGTGAHGIVDKIDVPFLGAGGQLSALFGRLIVFLLGLPVPMSPPLVKRAGVVRFIVRNIALCPEADDAAADLTAKMTLDCPVDGRAGGVRALTKDLDVREGVRNLVVPAFVVVGAQDRLMPATHGYEMADVLAETGWLERLVVYPGSGHMIGLEATEEYNALLREVAEQFSRTAVGADR